MEMLSTSLWSSFWKGTESLYQRYLTDVVSGITHDRIRKQLLFTSCVFSIFMTGLGTGSEEEKEVIRWNNGFMKHLYYQVSLANTRPRKLGGDKCCGNWSHKEEALMEETEELLLGLKRTWIQEGKPCTQKQYGSITICGPERTAECWQRDLWTAQVPSLAIALSWHLGLSVL